MLATWLLASQGHYWGVAVMVLVLAVITLWATWRSPETYRDDLTKTQ
jgi:MHS family shikimate/dehydroshikimate transporter-like MFS transporter